MDRSTQKFDHLLQKTNPGVSFSRSERSFVIPKNTSVLADRNLDYHYASNTQQVYSPFQEKYYIPPHLNSLKLYGLIHRGECQGWKIRHNENWNLNVYNREDGKNRLIKGRHLWNTTTNYDLQYRIYEDKINGLPKKKYEEIQPRIKYVLDLDKPNTNTKKTKPSKLYSEEDEQK